MLVLILSLTVLLAGLFPLPTILYSALGFVVGANLPPGPQRYLGFLLAYGPHLIVAWYMLRSLNAAPFVAQLRRGRRIALVGVALYAAYLLLAFGGLVLGAIPYGGGSVPRLLVLLLAVVHACLFAGLFIALFKELPVAQRVARK